MESAKTKQSCNQMSAHQDMMAAVVGVVVLTGKS